MKSYLIVVEAKLLKPINKTKLAFPTKDANCCDLDHLISGASAA